MDLEIWKDKRQLTALAVDEQPMKLATFVNVSAWPAVGDEVELASGRVHPIVRRRWCLLSDTLRVYVAWFPDNSEAERPRARAASAAL